MSIKSCRPLPKGTDVKSTRTRLPSDLIDKAVGRLAMVGLLSAIAHPFLYYGTRAAIPEKLLQGKAVPPVSMFAMWVVVVSGLAIYGLARSRKLNPGLMLDIGLLFEVVGALCIGLMEAPRFTAEYAVYGGPSGIA